MKRVELLAKNAPLPNGEAFEVTDEGKISHGSTEKMEKLNTKQMKARCRGRRQTVSLSCQNLNTLIRYLPM